MLGVYIDLTGQYDLCAEFESL